METTATIQSMEKNITMVALADVLNTLNTHDSELQKWLQWYKELYCF